MYYWDIWQPKLTTVLKNTKESIFEEFRAAISEEVSQESELNIIKYEEYWMVYCNFGGSHLWFSLHDHNHNFKYSASGFDIDCPIVDIHDFLIYPKGEGIGTKIIQLFLETLRKTKFEKIILKAESERAGRFWEKQGFTFKEKPPYSGMPSMFLFNNRLPKKDLELNIRYRNIGNKLNFKG
ncbi:GNAT family N-acetyltransferase [Rossellomorea aquimaris]|uniref:GNAT family N-acetyltransferase n=1 Tax=Rossellomorea aquimaris TaxID=189382 RepID=UPI0007D05CD6|nr:GNAT family N-acetyltransferase [Rossellomorea aquimaris]